MLELLAAAEPSEASLSTLAALEPAALDDYDRVTALQLVDRHVGWLAALEQMFIVAVGGHAPSADDDLGRYEIAAALRLSDTSAGSRLLVARELTGRLAATGAALASGRLTYFHARALVDATMALDDDTTALCRRVLPATAPLVAVFPLDLAEEFDVTVGVPGPGRPLPGGAWASTVHVGPYATLPLAYTALLEHVRERGHTATGPVTETYLADPTTAAPEELVTRLAVALAE